MIDTAEITSRLSAGRGSDVELPSNPSKEELRDAVQKLKSAGLCGGRIAEQQLGPYFMSIQMQYSLDARTRRYCPDVLRDTWYA